MALSYRLQDDDAVIASINTTPLVDVMLVLLIIFLITIPVVTTSIKVDLPQETNAVRVTKPENIVVSVNSQGAIFWYDAPVTNAQLSQRLTNITAQKPQPEVQIRGDGRADYKSVGQIVRAAQSVGIVKIDFITEPTSK